MNIPTGADPNQLFFELNPTSTTDYPSLQDALMLPKEKSNLHEQLAQIMEKFKINVDIDKIAPTNNVGQIGEINQQIQSLKKEIIESPKLLFDLKQLEKKYNLVIQIIVSGYLPDKPNLPSTSGKKLSANTDLNDDLIKGIRREHINDVTVAQLLRFRAATNADTRRDNNRDVYENFNKLVNDRSLGIMKSSSETTETTETIHLHPSVQIPAFGIISKKQLLSLIKQLEDIYGFVNNHSKWQNYMEYIRETIKKSFQDYCDISVKHKQLMELKSLVDKWADAYETVTTFVKKTTITSLEQQKAISEMLSSKNETDQIFTANLLKQLDIDQITEQMNQVSRVFKTHYKMINEFVQPIIKPNMCKICLTESCDRFIDSCGHTLCNTCAQRLLNNEAQSFSVASGHSMCPYCNKDFTKENIKPIYW
jgi:hypothetical protein